MTATLLSLASTWFRNGHVNQVWPIPCEKESSGDPAKVSHSKKESESEMVFLLALNDVVSECSAWPSLGRKGAGLRAQLALFQWQCQETE